MSNELKKVLLLLLVLPMIVSGVGCRRSPEPEPVPDGDPSLNEMDSENQVDTSESQNNDADRHYFVLYLKHRDHPYIFSDTFHIRENDPALNDQSLAEYVMKRLLAHEPVGELVNPIPSETELLSLIQEGRRVTVNLSREFAEDISGTEYDIEATIAMIVNTMITLPGIDRVVLQIEGTTPDEIQGVSIQREYEFMTDYYPDK